MVFAGGRLPTPAMVPLVAWGVVASLSAKSCEGVINATMQEEPRKAKLRQQLPGLAAVVGVYAAQHVGTLPGTSLTHRVVTSGLLGGYLLVECSLSHLRLEVDQLVLTVLEAVRPPLGSFLRPVARGALALRRSLLPLPALVANRLDVLRTAAHSAAREAEAWFDRTSRRWKVAVVSAVGVATQVPGVRGTARGLVSKVLDGQLESFAQAALPPRLRERNVTASAGATARALAPFRALVTLYREASALLARSARWALPFFFAVWGCAVQTGQLALVRDAPRALVYLLPLKWAEVVPEPANWVAKQAKQAYAALLVSPVKRVVKRGASGAVSKAISMKKQLAV